MRILLASGLLLSIIAVCSCGSSKKGTSEVYSNLAMEKYGSSGQYEVSPDGTYILCYSEVKGTVDLPNNSVSFVVYNLATNDVIYEDKVASGSVGWYDNNQLEIFYLPGIMPPSKSKNDFIEIYNVETKRRVKKSELEVSRD